MLQNHPEDINRSFSFLTDLINSRLQQFFKKENEQATPVEQDNISLNSLLKHHQLNTDEYVILLLALMPHIQPCLLDNLIQQYLPNGGEFAEIGGVKGSNHRGTIPTGETALFMLAGNDIDKRMQVSKYLSADHFFAKENILQLEAVKEGEPRMSGKIILHQEYAELFTTGVVSKPLFSPEFPAKLVTTKMEWEDLIINPKNGNSNK